MHFSAAILTLLRIGYANISVLKVNKRISYVNFSDLNIPFTKLCFYLAIQEPMDFICISLIRWKPSVNSWSYFLLLLLTTKFLLLFHYHLSFSFSVFVFIITNEKRVQLDTAWLSSILLSLAVVAIFLGHCSGAYWVFALEPIKMESVGQVGRRLIVQILLKFFQNTRKRLSILCES